MKPNLNSLSRRYATTLRDYLKRGSRASLKPALELGLEAVALGLETLAMARVHEQALLVLKIPPDKTARVRRAELFFTEAIIPIVANHRPARESRRQVARLTKTLGQRTARLAASDRHVQQGAVRHKSVEAALKKSSNHYTRLLKDSLHLQEGLRQLTHRVLATQEEERRKISLELQDEISQTLLGINVRLLSLKQEARRNTTSLRNEIASTERLVLQSTSAVRRVARKYEKS